MLPTHPDSVPFLLVRVRPTDDDVEDLLDEEDTIPPRSVPPRAPPQGLSSLECALPSVIVDLRALEAEAEAATLELEAQRDSDVDGLLASADADYAANEYVREPAPTYPSIAVARETSRWRATAVMLLTIAVAGGACAGLAAHGVSAHGIGAALHLR